MERLQEALSRARERRESGATVPASGEAQSEMARRPASRASPEASVDVWRRLPPFEPNERLLKANRVVAYFGGREAAPFDMMRTKILQQVRTNGWRRIVVTSPTAQCGKTTITVNLGFSLARNTDLRVLVVELDLRRPELASLLGIRDRLAFVRYLSGEDSAAQHMIGHGDNLAFAASTAPSANPSELLQSTQARKQLEALEQEFSPDLVLYDMPPVLASDDTLGFLEFADAALIVAAAEQSSVDDIDVTEGEIAAVTNVLGVVLNKTRYTGRSAAYEGAYY